jgi:O-antigen ligase
MRIVACYLLVAFFSCFAYKRWFTSLCAAIVMMAVLEHPDMPRSIGGIQGLNLWNVLIANVVLAWWIDKKRDGRRLDFPPHARFWLLLFVVMILISTMRLLISPGVLAREESTASMISEYVVNCMKWLIPGVLLFDGCRTRSKTKAAIICILAVYFLLAVQVIRWMPLTEIASDSFARRSYKMAENEIGYNRVTLSMMLGGGGWAIMSALVLVQNWRARMAIFFAGAATMLGQALTGGRAGYGCWLAVGVCLCLVRWRKLLLFIPVAIIIVFTCLPAVRDRLLQGIAGGTGNVDQYALTSGRNIAWPFVIQYITKSPILGYGRQAMATTGIRDMLMRDFNESFPHPHNAYFETFLDNGVFGLLIVLMSFFVIFRHALGLLRDKNDPFLVAMGGICISLVLALLFGSIGGQTFYPREGSVGMWAAIGVAFRLSVQRHAALQSGLPLFPDDVPEDLMIVTREGDPSGVSS